ncbi:Uncharacterized protein APZ42_026275 [Daphnia magna]|uniref:Uncharacterized protein n=1 Tax=Daphnia magna TaxID=35525 RepID=A0A162EDI8_9CRUS|nr:Uncharacterized protein APZ42_026275 [Daphnia magna]
MNVFPPLFSAHSSISQVQKLMSFLILDSKREKKRNFSHVLGRRKTQRQST